MDGWIYWIRTEGQCRQQDDHVDTDDHTSTLGRGDLREIQRRNDGQSASAYATEQSGEQDEAIDAGREDLHHQAAGPDGDEHLPTPQATESVGQRVAEQRAERCTEHAKRRDVGLSVRQSLRVVLPVGRVQVVVGFEGLQAH